MLVVAVVSLILIGASCIVVARCMVQDLRAERDAEAFLVSQHLRSVNDNTMGAKHS